jgi:AcrR family transcriptional regulator
LQDPERFIYYRPVSYLFAAEEHVVVKTSKPAPPRSPRWHRRPTQRPEEILEAALELFGELGFARTKLEDVARRAGVSKGTVYLYFDSKETLFREMVRTRIVSTVAESEAQIREHQGDNRELLERLARRLWRVVRDPDTARIIRVVHSELGHFPELARFYFDEVILRARRVMETVIQRGMEAGEFRRVDVQWAARALPLLMVHSAQFQCFLGAYEASVLSDDRVFAGILDLFLNGTLARPEAPPAGA